MPARILLVDDNPLGSTARGMILKDHGYEVETALSGEEAWELFQKSHFDIVVTDYRMEAMTGLDLIQLIRATDSPARIVLLSGFLNGLGMTELSTGADELVAKSDKEVPELLRAIKKLAAQPNRRAAASDKAVSQGAALRRTSRPPNKANAR
ncbi:MAG TPA: response regulator [Bryobacteraceae bacterium]|nr:response regulator [Bryobacteraceae bacterium]